MDFAIPESTQQLLDAARLQQRWSPLLQRKVRAGARERLAAYQAAQG